MNDEQKNLFFNKLEQELGFLLSDNPDSDKAAFKHFSINDIKESFGLTIDNEFIIEKLVNNRKPFSSLGICEHDDNFLCEHRKRYILNYVIKTINKLLIEIEQPKQGEISNDIQS